MRNTLRRIFLVALCLTACTRPTEPSTPAPEPLGVRLPTATPHSTRLPGERTPPPTFTPAPTPTPVVHIVEPGETLIEIAQRYGITLDALQAANGVLTPETLQIGQRLVIPVGIGGWQPAPNGGILLPTPTPLAAMVQGTALYETPAGSVWVLGEVVNPGGSSLENTQVRVALLDVSGAEAAVGTAFTALDVIPAGGKAPFGVLFVSPPEAVSFVVTAIRAEASSEPGNRYMPIAVSDQRGALDGLQFNVTGTVVNQGPSSAMDVSAVVTTYDADGRVTGYREARVGDGRLAAQAAAEFNILLAPTGPAGPMPGEYSIVAQGRTQRP